MNKNKYNIVFFSSIEPKDAAVSFMSGYIMFLAPLLEVNKLLFKILDASLLLDYSIKGVIDELKKIDFDAVGMTTYADNIRNVYKLSNAIKAEFPDKKIILGGPQASFQDEKILHECMCDIIIRNEGETKIVEILNCLNHNIPLKNIKGISYKEGNTIIRNKDADFLDINSLPTPQYGILSQSKYWIIPNGISEDKFTTHLTKVRKSYSIFMTGRGCPYSCTFCVEGNIANSVRYRSPENVKSDLEYFLSVTKHNYITIGDDTFTSSPKRVREICNVFKEVQKKHSFFWFCEGRVDILSKHPEMITEMYNAGLRKLQIGIESGNQKVLDIYNKKITLDQIEKVVIEASKHKYLTIHGNIILGNPKEGMRDFLKSLEFIKHLYLLSNFNLSISKSYLTPFVGTPIRSNPEKYDIEILEEDFEFSIISLFDIACKPKDLSFSDLNNLRHIADKELHNYVCNNIFKIPRSEIIDKYKYYHKNKNVKPSETFRASFGELNSFKVLNSIINRGTTIELTKTNYSLIRELSPLRLWEIEHLEKNKYRFVTLSDEEIIIDNENYFLWQKSTGKMSVNEIYYEFKKHYNQSIDYIVKFYLDMQEKMALVFVDF